MELRNEITRLLDQLSDEQVVHVAELAMRGPEPNHSVETDDRYRYPDSDRVTAVARVMVEGCQLDKFTFGCLDCRFFDTGRAICTDIERLNQRTIIEGETI